VLESNSPADTSQRETLTSALAKGLSPGNTNQNPTGSDAVDVDPVDLAAARRDADARLRLERGVQTIKQDELCGTSCRTPRRRPFEVGIEAED
jgi:hypothetical protein